MALRIRKDGRILCAAKFPEEENDTYIHDGLHYILSVEEHATVTDSNHFEHGEWWWSTKVPDGIIVDEWWKNAT